MTRDEFFEWCIWSVVGIEKDDGTGAYYFRQEDKKMAWIATLEKVKTSSMLWVSWPRIYLPLIQNFGMTEKDVTDYIKNKMNVDLIGFMPSIERAEIHLLPTDRLTVDSKQEYDELVRKMNQHT